MIAATRLGNLPNPKWCFSDSPFYPTVAADYVIGNTDPMSFLIMHTFESAHEGIGSSTSPMGFVACENIN
jgi:hypothetical protein